jgi:hypothetical protein
VNGVLDLSAAGGPYLLSGDFTVPAGARLRCEPGTIILVGSDGRLSVQGEVEALGTPDQPVVFRRTRCNESWRGIAITGTGIAGAPSRFRHCDFRFPGDLTGGVLIRISNVVVELESCLFEGEAGIALEATDAALTVTECSFGNWQTGIRSVRTVLNATGSVFERMNRQALVLEGAGAGPSRLSRCSIYNLLGTAIEAISADATIHESMIRDCKLGLLERGGALRLENAVIAGCLSGILVTGGGVLAGDHVTAAGNYYFLEMQGSAAARSRFDLENSILWGNRRLATLGPETAFSAAYSCIEGDEAWPGEGNLYADPLFADFAHWDYRLQPGSPAIGTGRAGTDMGAFPAGGKTTRFSRGDCDRDGELAITDAVKILIGLFLGGGEPPCQDACDVDDSGDLSVTDPIYLLNYLFLGGDPIPAPHPDPGEDTTADALTCAS